jgi:hypothetical protein
MQSDRVKGGAVDLWETDFTQEVFAGVTSFA